MEFFFPPIQAVFCLVSLWKRALLIIIITKSEISLTSFYYYYYYHREWINSITITYLSILVYVCHWVCIIFFFSVFLINPCYCVFQLVVSKTIRSDVLSMVRILINYRENKYHVCLLLLLFRNRCGRWLFFFFFSTRCLNVSRLKKFS